MTSVLSKLWRGQYSLPMAFLGFYIFGFCVALFAAFLVMGFAAQFEALFVPLLLFCLAAVTAYWIVASVGVWRSAAASMASENWVNRLEAWLARGMVALLAAYGAWSLSSYGLSNAFVPA